MNEIFLALSLLIKCPEEAKTYPLKPGQVLAFIDENGKQVVRRGPKE